MTTRNVNQIRDERYRVITIVGDWRLHPKLGEDDMAWRYVEVNVLPAHQHVHLECFVKSLSPWSRDCAMMRDLTRHIRSNHWNLAVVDTMTTLSVSLWGGNLPANARVA